MWVDIATDLMIKALATDNYGTYLDYSHAILSEDVLFSPTDIKKIQKKIAKVRAMRDDIAADLHRARIKDSREHPIDQPMLDMDYIPDMTRGIQQ